MHLFLPAGRTRGILITLLITLGIGSYIHNQYLIEKIREQESASVELWAKAIEFNSRPVHEQVTTQLNEAIHQLRLIPEVPDSLIRQIERVERAQSVHDFVTENLVLSDRFRVPSVVVDEQGEILIANHIRHEDVSPELISQFAAMHNPVRIELGDERLRQTQYVYYSESQTVQYLRYFPYVQSLLLALLLGIGYTTLHTINRSEQSNLWVGMAKEAAHQLGTPISSLFGWVQLLKDRLTGVHTDPVIQEIEKDIARLSGVAERFNKIGSRPELKEMNLEPVVDQAIRYMESRLPQHGRQVEVQRVCETEAKVRINPELFHWAIENLIRNAMDAVRSSSKDPRVIIAVTQLEESVYIDISDSGNGISKKSQKEIFKPGFSTKKRGWGLGLSLARRIIEEYHKGRLEVLQTSPERGTTMRITLQATPLESGEAEE